jgi:hypothetical protein
MGDCLHCDLLQGVREYRLAHPCNCENQLDSCVGIREVLNALAASATLSRPHREAGAGAGRLRQGTGLVEMSKICSGKFRSARAFHNYLHKHWDEIEHANMGADICAALSESLLEPCIKALQELRPDGGWSFVAFEDSSQGLIYKDFARPDADAALRWMRTMTSLGFQVHVQLPGTIDHRTGRLC